MEEDNKSSVAVYVSEKADGHHPKAGVQSEVEVDSREQSMLDGINRLRALGGDCGPAGRYSPAAAVVASAILMDAAEAHGKDMAGRGFFSHENPEGSGPQERARRAGFEGDIAENLSWGTEGVDAALEQWLKSSGHCATLLNSRWSQVGIAFARSRTRAYWVALFGRPARKPRRLGVRPP